MPNFIRTTMAATASVGILALTPASAQAATLLSDASATPSPTTVSAPTAAPATSTSAPAKPKMTKHERKLMIHHRRKVRRGHRVARALSVVARQQGDPYQYGATGPNAFDCSGLMLYAFRAVGLHLPRTAAAQSGAVRHISRSHMRRGDLVFFNSGGHVYHVGIFDGWSHGRRMMIDAPHSGTDVRREPIWGSSWFVGTMRLA